MSHHRRDRHPRPSRANGSNSRRVLGHAERVEINHAPLSDADAEQPLLWQDPVWSNHDMAAGRGAAPYFSSRMTTMTPGWDSHGAGTSDPVFSNGTYYADLYVLLIPDGRSCIGLTSTTPARPSQMDSFNTPTWQASSTSHATGSYVAQQVATSPTSPPVEPPSTGIEGIPYDDWDGFGSTPHYGDGPGAWPGSTAPDGMGVADYDMNSMSIGRRWSIQARQGSNGYVLSAPAGKVERK